MKTVSILTRSLDKQTADVAFRDISPDIALTSRVLPNKYQYLISDDPLTVGTEFHSLLERMADRARLSPKEKAYLPWMSALRTIVWDLGAYQMDMDYELKSQGVQYHGECDLRVHGGPQKFGVIEVKTITTGNIFSPRGRDLAQVSAYSRLIAGRSSYDSVWAAVAYIELQNLRVNFFGYTNSRALIKTADELFRAA
jgi:hypothetical protein